MTRRRLWTMTALACAFLILVSMPGAAWREMGERTVAMARAVGPLVSALAERIPRELNREAMLALAPIGGGMAAAALALLLRFGMTRARHRTRRPSQRTVQRMARRGSDVAAIARHTRLAQDAVRDLIGGESSSERSRESAPSFAATLREASLHQSA